MKKQLLGLVALGLPLHASVCRVDSCDTEVTSKTYLASRQPFLSDTPELVAGFRYDRIHAKEDGSRGASQIVLFGNKSLNTDDLTRYFMPFGKLEVPVSSAIADFSGNNNDLYLLAENFNIFTQNPNNFLSVISMAPQQSMVGIGFYYRQSFYRDTEKNRGFWGSVSFAGVRVKNFLNFCEQVVNNGGGVDTTQNPNAVANMLQAVNQPAWHFGKISPVPLTKTGVADMEVKIGYEWLDFEPVHLESYAGVLVPTGNTPNGKYLWEPIVGQGHHAGLIWGSAVGVQIWCNEYHNRTLRAEYAFHSQYLFQNIECRSFDLKGKPWSRYLPVYRNQQDAAYANYLLQQGNTNLATTYSTPGINVFTQPVQVTPRFLFNMLTAIVYSDCGFQAEIGYNFWARQSECVKLACPWQQVVAIKDNFGDGQTNPVRDITNNPLLNMLALAQPFDEYEANTILEEQLDLVSAAQPAGISNTLYGSLTYRWDDRCFPLLINAGASYEMSNSNNSIVSRWTAWGKFGVSF